MSEEMKKSDVANREEATLAFWKERDIFQQSVEKEPTKGEFVFFDGPPFATGTPHYGHLLQSAVKDAIPRYKTMQGFRVKRQWGWDCHGLPIENIVEKEIGSKSKKDILAMGVKKFNDLCRERIFTFIHEWERIIPRFGRWADMEKPYRTMDFEYMQSEWWAFKTLFEKGLIYEDYRSMHICPRCETTLSQGEVAEGYKDIKDLSVTVKFKLKSPEKIGLSGDVYLLAWTTTPWTLPGNVALAVRKDIEYVAWSDKAEHGTETYIVAGKRFNEMGIQATTLNVLLPGRSLVDLEYEPLFDTYAKDEKLKNRERGWEVYAADFVTTDTGTGIVHIAPAFGADDMALGKKENLPFVQHVGIDGIFKSEVTEFPGLDLKPRAKDKPEEIREADLTIVRHLEERGLVFEHKKYSHSYPHCWRCDTALLNYATGSWFVAVEKIKPQLLETAEKIHWSPEHIKEGRFGQWLLGARDWSISRQRFWANTIPVWRCEKCKAQKVFGSAEELAQTSGTLVTDLHKDVVDTVEFTCDCGAHMKRVPDVLDTWFDSGSVPFAAKSYGTAAKARGEKITPADFLAEAQDQTRAWFYYQHVLVGALFGMEAFKNCIVTGIVLAEDGKKMSKKLQNYPDPALMIDKYGADAMRFYMLSSPVTRAENLSFSEKGVDEIVKKNLGRLTNVLAFYKLYADGTVRDWKSENVLDRWILARLDQLVHEATDGYEKYAMDEAVRPVIAFIDDLSVWYLRRSRDRFKTDDEDKKAALATMRYVLHALARVLAPSMPFIAEHLFQEIREEEDEESVHLSMWPEPLATANFFARLLGQGASNEDLLKAMEKARAIVTQALEAREKAGIRIRQPLPLLTIPESSGLADAYLRIVAEELNVKKVEQTGMTIVLDTVISEELREEGLVRDTIRAIQAARKENNLQKREASTYKAHVSADDRKVIEKYKKQIETETGSIIEFS